MSDEPQKKRRRRRRGGRGRGKGGGQQPVAQQPQQQEQPKPKPKVDPQDQLGAAILEMLPSRDLEVLDWLSKSLGKAPGRLVFEMVKTSIVRERVAYRESKGGGGSSSRDAEQLAARLPGRS